MKVAQIKDVNLKTKFGRAISIFKNRSFFIFKRRSLSNPHDFLFS